MDTADSIELIKGDYEALIKEHGNNDPLVVGWASRTEQLRRYNVLAHTPEHRPSLGHVLEVGCGRGAFMKVPGAGSFTSYTGIDMVGEHITYALNAYKLDNVVWEWDDAIPWLSNTTYRFDTVLASGTLAHYTAGLARELLSRMWFVVRDGGYMAFNWNRLTCGITDRDMLIILNDIGVEKYVVRHDYIPNDYTVLAYK